MDTELYLPGMKACSDGSCIFRHNTGMVTNGGCSCQRELSRTEWGLQAVKTILYLRKQAKQAFLEGYSEGYSDGKQDGELL